MTLATLILAICFVESSQIQNSVNISDGGSASFGECQIKGTTAKLMGYKGHITKLWFDKETNKKYSFKYLEWQFKRYNNLKKAVAAYNSGSVKYNKKGQLVNKKYVNKVFSVAQCFSDGLWPNCYGDDRTKRR